MADNASSKQPAAPFAVLVDVKPSPSAMAGNTKRLPSFPAVVVEMACVWALTNAFVSAGFSILTMILNRTPCTESMLFFRCVALTHAAAAEAGALVHGQLWCSAPQAVAAALALALLVRGKGKRCSRSRWALAAVAVAATAANHYMELRRVQGVFLAAAQEDVYLLVDAVVASVCLGVDLFGFLCLLLLGDGEE